MYKLFLQQSKGHKGEQPFLATTHCLDLHVLHIPIKFHEDICNGYSVMVHTFFFTMIKGA